MTSLPPDRRRPRAFRLSTGSSPIEDEPQSSSVEPAKTAPDSEPAHPAEPPPRRPRVFATDPISAATIEIQEQPDPYRPRDERPEPDGELAIETAQKRGMLGGGWLSWGGLFWSAIGGLLSLTVGLWVTRLIDDLFARVPGLGWLGLALAGLALPALLGLGVREALGIIRQKHVAALHKQIADARLGDDGKAARSGLVTLAGLYAARPETARAREELSRLSAEIIDGRDLIDLAERHLMVPLDILARREIADAAKRVSVVTAISPRAILDLLFVIAQTIRLIRRIAEIYSGRPGLLGFMRLARSVGAHLAITGGMAVGDSLLQQAVGHGIAAKLSRRLGEGVLNGLLTTRVGLSAMAVCRPMPFAAVKQPGVGEVAPFLFGGGDKTE